MKSSKKYIIIIISIILGTAFLLKASQVVSEKQRAYKIKEEKLNRISEFQNIRLVEAFPNLSFTMPVEFVSPNDHSNRNFVVSQKGEIYVFENTASVKNSLVFLDIKNRIISGGERGLLGLAFHPDFKNNGYFYVNYTRNSPELETVIARFKAQNNNTVSDSSSEEILLTYKQPFSNHNGGKIAFGPDGYLYIAVGDGGSGGDPKKNGQNKSSLLGKILRINVNQNGGGINYTIPSDNPFIGNTQGFRQEIYAYGMRNPWKFSFDKLTGELWAVDVGQNKIEEIDIIRNGENYGWNVMEADECFGQANCDTSNLILPVWSYHQGPQTGNSVTGGYVYRGSQIKALKGKYIYGDYVTGNIWSLSPSANGKYLNDFLLKHKGLISSFGEDSSNELYVCSYGDGKIYKIVE